MPTKQFKMEFRTLDNSVPELKRYLGRGMTVLDIGCGRGEITCSVADYVYPGKITGIDPNQDWIADAIERIKKAEAGVNIDFFTCDSHELPFEDNSFDIAYCNTALHFYIDPVLALNEQRRVVKPGGWVIASGVRGLPGTRFPHCPNWEKADMALGNYWAKVAERYNSKKLKPSQFMEEERAKIDGYMMTYLNRQAGLKCAGWFKEIALKNLEISVKSDSVTYHGSFRFKPGTWDMLPKQTDDEDYAASNIQEPLEVLYKEMVKNGEVAQSVLDAAAKEVADWYRNPCAFSYSPMVFAAGQK